MSLETTTEPEAPKAIDLLARYGLDEGEEIDALVTFVWDVVEVLTDYIDQAPGLIWTFEDFLEENFSSPPEGEGLVADKWETLPPEEGFLEELRRLGA